MEKKVHIWDDKWIPTPTNVRVMSPRKHVVGENNVPSLIERDIGAWKFKVVRNNFLPHEADVILGISLSSPPPPFHCVDCNFKCNFLFL